MRQRFKNPEQEKCYQVAIRATPEQVADTYTPGGNWDSAFKAGYLGYNSIRYPKNSRLYAIYVAGKEWLKHNPQHADSPLLAAMNAHKQRVYSRLNK